MYKRRTRLLAPPGPSTATKAKEKGSKKVNKIHNTKNSYRANKMPGSGLCRPSHAYYEYVLHTHIRWSQSSLHKFIDEFTIKLYLSKLLY